MDSAKLSDAPIFEIFGPNKRFRIWADGRHDGFGDDAVIMINRIPIYVNRRVKEFTDLTKEERTAYFNARCKT